MRYLVNENSPKSAGWYEAEVATTLLSSAEDQGWAEAAPDAPPPPPKASLLPIPKTAEEIAAEAEAAETAEAQARYDADAAAAQAAAENPTGEQPADPTNTGGSADNEGK